MKYVISLIICFLLIFSGTTVADAPSSGQVITTFVPVVIYDFKQDEKEPSPKPVIRLTPPTVIVHTVPVVTRKYSPTVQDARNYALNTLGPTQYSCIDQIFTHESHWNPYDLNKSSGAYGIPQAVPGSKMATAGSDWKTNPVTQVKWGIHYVNGRYGSACSAWSFWQVHRWY